MSGADTATARGDDSALLDRARAGDRAAFGALVERHHVVLAALIRQRGGVRAPIEDLVQETFARALTHLGGFRGRASFVTWAGSIALNLASDWRRKETRRARLTPRADVEHDALPCAQTPQGSDLVQRREDAATARAALDELPAPMRLAVTLRVVEELSYET